MKQVEILGALVNVSFSLASFIVGMVINKEKNRISVTLTASLR